MKNFISRVWPVVVVVSAMLITAGCAGIQNSAGDVAPSVTPGGADEVPAQVSREPAAPQPSPTRPAATPEPTAVELPTEIQEPEGSAPISTVLPTQSSEETMVPVEVQSIPGSEAPLAAAVAHLSDQTGTPPEEIKVVSIEAVNWPDTSLGCPQEGMMYAQVITQGYKIVLEAQGQQYEYHTNEQEHAVLCPRP
jgi:hypothetical protein